MFKINYSRKLRRQFSLADSADAYTAKKGEVGKRRRKGGRERRRRLLLMDGGRWEGRKGRGKGGGGEKPPFAMLLYQSMRWPTCFLVRNKGERKIEQRDEFAPLFPPRGNCTKNHR